MAKNNTEINMPQKNSFWSAVYLNGEMGIFRNWGDLSWNKLREDYQRDFSEEELRR